MPSPYAHILYHSRLNPGAPAVVIQGTTINFGEFCRHIERVTRQLHKCAIKPGSIVGVHVADAYFHWLLVISLSRLGLPSASVSTKELDILSADLILSEQPGELRAGTAIGVNPAWYQESAENLPPFEDRTHEPGAAARIILSSGTTGTPKRVLLTYGHLHTRNKSQIADYNIGPATRLLVTMSISTVGGYGLPRNCWAAGGAVVLPVVRRNQPLSQLLAADPNVLFISPAQLENIVNSLPRGFTPRDMRIYVAGSVLPQPLSIRTRLRLSPWLYNCYGSTEIGTVTLAPVAHTHFKPYLTGYVVPPVRVEIVDESDRPVPSGTLGQVRIRSECQVDSYMDDPETTALCFRDGWFYPGDLGSLDDEGGLYLQGRVSELMNLGGMKLTPGRVEDLLRETPGVGDLAVFSTRSANQGEVPHVVVVPSGELSEEELRARYRRAFPGLPPLTVHRVESIPRNEMGKVLRAELRTNFSHAAGILH